MATTKVTRWALLGRDVPPLPCGHRQVKRKVFPCGEARNLVLPPCRILPCLVICSQCGRSWEGEIWLPGGRSRRRARDKIEIFVKEG